MDTTSYGGVYSVDVTADGEYIMAIERGGAMNVYKWNIYFSMYLSIFQTQNSSINSNLGAISDDHKFIFWSS